MKKIILLSLFFCSFVLQARSTHSSVEAPKKEVDILEREDAAFPTDSNAYVHGTVKTLLDKTVEDSFDKKNFNNLAFLSSEDAKALKNDLKDDIGSARTYFSYASIQNQRELNE